MDSNVDVFQACVALPVDPGIDASFHGQHPVGLMELEFDPDRLREDDPFKWLNWDVVGNDHLLTAAGQQTTDVDFV